MLQRHHTDGVRPPGIESKVSALEQQMARVNSSLESITTLLQRVVDPIEKHRSPQQPTTLPIGTNQVVFAPQTHGVAQDPVGISSAVDSLQAWVQRIASADINVNANANKGDDSEVQSWDDGDDGGKDAEGTMMMKEMLKSEEDARLEADGHIPLSGAKKRKFDSVSEYDEQRKMKPSVLDAIDIGLCSEADGRHLFNVFFRGAHGFMPVFDQLEDTWPSLRQRSPFSITAILFVGRKILDGGGPASKLQLQLREHAENIGKTTLFSPIATIEALQAMIILASWGDTGWRPGTHALSMAFDMELYKCLPKLAEQASKGRARNDKSTAATVVGARLWLLVTKMAIEMAYNHGRPLLLDTTDALAHTRALLTHPLALPTDSRIVAGCELLILRLPLHQIFLSGQERSLDTALKAFNEGSRQWEKRWTEFYGKFTSHSDRSGMRLGDV